MQEGRSRDGYDDAKISRDRALVALVEAEDFLTKRSLWRLALRMNGKMKATDAEGTGSPGVGLPHDRAQGDGTRGT